jgi:hypothetical protein
LSRVYLPVSIGLGRTPQTIVLRRGDEEFTTVVVGMIAYDSEGQHVDEDGEMLDTAEPMADWIVTDFDDVTPVPLSYLRARMSGTGPVSCAVMW